jgi:transposase
VFDATTVLFGLPGVRVERVERHADGTRVVDVVTNEPTAAACPSRGVVSTSVKGCVVTSPKDIPYGEGRIVVRWNKVRWRCREDYCERGSFTEAIAEVPARARSTLGLRQQIAKAVGDAARSVAEVAQAHGGSWPTVHRAFIAHATTVLTEPAPTPVLGIDETRRGKPRWERCAETGRWMRGRPLGYWVRRPGRRSGAVGAASRPQPRRRGGMAQSAYTAVPRQRQIRRQLIPLPPMPGRSARLGCCPTRRWWSIIST